MKNLPGKLQGKLQGPKKIEKRTTHRDLEHATGEARPAGLPNPNRHGFKALAGRAAQPSQAGPHNPRRPNRQCGDTVWQQTV